MTILIGQCFKIYRKKLAYPRESEDDNLVVSVSNHTFCKNHFFIIES